ncbi:hypothetical protein B9479_003255 [Cryptococcus floricola]|uniref:DNA repair protein RAD5 n=1 Tax=Cryptococcus floricola TaxID=2591691 RepID=A0A5D3B157_9TREE|nr:hypothetical protein B9479_003255 [Cryptococcus floricola]
MAAITPIPSGDNLGQPNGTTTQPHPDLAQSQSQPSIDLTGDDSDGDDVVETSNGVHGANGNTTSRSPQTSMFLGARAPDSRDGSPSTQFLPKVKQQLPNVRSPFSHSPYIPSNPAPGSSRSLYNQTVSGWAPGNAVHGNGMVQPPAPPPINAGVNSSSAIDLTSRNIPSPPPQVYDDKHPICIGSLRSSALMLYPCPAVVVGAVPPPGTRERYDIVEHRGVEFIKVKLKYRASGTLAKKDDPESVLPRDIIQVLTPSLTVYIGDLDARVAMPLASLMARGLCRLEGFVPRLHEDAPQYQVHVDVLVFTLPSNINYIAEFLTNHNLFLLDPIPPYDPARHSDHPPYRNAHGSGEQAQRMLAMAQRRALTGDFVFSDKERDKTTQVEVQRMQVDEVFKTLEDGMELEQSDPGPLIKTHLFPHQRKALTFFLLREQDSSCLRQCKKAAKKLLKKRGESEMEAEEEKARKRDEDEGHGSLWEYTRDDKGKIRSWKNRITGEELRGKKGKPTDCKGSLLADDMGLGKTLSVVSLIAATRSSAREYARSKPEPARESPKQAEEDAEMQAGPFRTKVFGMPDISEQPCLDTNSKKRKRDEDQTIDAAARRARIACRSKATLLITPMSTISNWEDQIKEHWNGPVEIVGGASGVMPPRKIERKWKPPKANGEESDNEDLDNFDLLRIYIYHGPSRRPDPKFISEFDIVITSFNTLANEYSKQSGSDTESNTPGETANNSGDDVPDNRKVDTAIKPGEVAAAIKGGKKGRGKGKGMETSPLQAIDWFRVVLDEAHYIKTASTVASQAACALEADRRVALSGTPIQNKIEDVWALFKFIRISPVDDKDVFMKYIASPCKYGEQIGVARLQLVMRCCTLRRTKESHHEDGSKILNLPPRSERQMWLTLREDERQVYDERASRAKNKLGELKANNETSKIYVNMLQEVLRLRQICNHVDLAMLGPVEEDYDGTIMDYEVAASGIEKHGLTQQRAVAVVCSQKEGEGANCVSCGFDFGEWFPWIGLGGVEEEKEKPKVKKLTNKPLMTKCLHLFCPSCFKNSVYPEYSKRSKTTVARACSCCNTMIRLPSDVIEVLPPDSADASEQALGEQVAKRGARKKYVRQPGEKLNLSTKMQFLHDELLRFSKRNPHSAHYDPFAMDGEDDVEEMDAEGKPFVTKSVVFSQWTTMLDRICDMLDETNIRYARLDGTMTREERSKAIDALKYKKNVEVLLVSTRAGGVGLNLTVASRCYLVDPYWNPSVESQAIDRIHRMGQTRPVVAIKLMIKDSIEEKLDKIQKKKADLATLSLKTMTRKELLAQKSEELASLFS